MGNHLYGKPYVVGQLSLSSSKTKEKRKKEEEKKQAKNIHLHYTAYNLYIIVLQYVAK